MPKIILALISLQILILYFSNSPLNTVEAKPTNRHSLMPKFKNNFQADYLKSHHPFLREQNLTKSMISLLQSLKRRRASKRCRHKKRRTLQFPQRDFMVMNPDYFRRIALQQKVPEAANITASSTTSSNEGSFVLVRPDHFNLIPGQHNKENIVSKTIIPTPLSARIASPDYLNAVRLQQNIQEVASMSTPSTTSLTINSFRLVKPNNFDVIPLRQNIPKVVDVNDAPKTSLTANGLIGVQPEYLIPLQQNIRGTESAVNSQKIPLFANGLSGSGPVVALQHNTGGVLSEVNPSKTHLTTNGLKNVRPDCVVPLQQSVQKAEGVINSQGKLLISNGLVAPEPNYLNPALLQQNTREVLNVINTPKTSLTANGLKDVRPDYVVPLQQSVREAEGVVNSQGRLLIPNGLVAPEPNYLNPALLQQNTREVLNAINTPKTPLTANSLKGVRLDYIAPLQQNVRKVEGAVNSQTLPLTANELRPSESNYLNMGVLQQSIGEIPTATIAPKIPATTNGQNNVKPDYMVPLQQNVQNAEDAINFQKMPLIANGLTVSAPAAILQQNIGEAPNSANLPKIPLTVNDLKDIRPNYLVPLQQNVREATKIHLTTTGLKDRNPDSPNIIPLQKNVQEIVNINPQKTSSNDLRYSRPLQQNVEQPNPPLTANDVLDIRPNFFNVMPLGQSIKYFPNMGTSPIVPFAIDGYRIVSPEYFNAMPLYQSIPSAMPTVSGGFMAVGPNYLNMHEVIPATSKNPKLKPKPSTNHLPQDGYMILNPDSYKLIAFPQNVRKVPANEPKLPPIIVLPPAGDQTNFEGQQLPPIIMLPQHSATSSTQKLVVVEPLDHLYLTTMSPLKEDLIHKFNLLEDNDSNTDLSTSTSTTFVSTTTGKANVINKSDEKIPCPNLLEAKPSDLAVPGNEPQESNSPSEDETLEYAENIGKQVAELVNAGSDNISKNITEDIAKNIAEIQTMQNHSNKDGMLCNVTGSWSSSTGGVLLDITKHFGKLDISINHKTPRANGFLINSKGWKFSGIMPFSKHSQIVVTGVNEITKQVATFIGECRTCGSGDTMSGSWLLARPSRDCNDQKGAIEMLGDLWRRESLTELRNKKWKQIRARKCAKKKRTTCDTTTTTTECTTTTCSKKSEKTTKHLKMFINPSTITHTTRKAFTGLETKLPST